MIEVESVQPTARELRAIQRGWGAMHWWMCIPPTVPFVGLLAVALAAIAAAPWDEVLGRAVMIILIATCVFWFGSRWIVARVTLAAARKAPAARSACNWTLDEGGVVFHTPLSSAWMDWALVKDVREDGDRFVLLVSPQNNPVLPKRQLSAEQSAAVVALVAEVRASGRLGRGVD